MLEVIKTYRGSNLDDIDQPISHLLQKELTVKFTSAILKTAIDLTFEGYFYSFVPHIHLLS